MKFLRAAISLIIVFLLCGCASSGEVQATPTPTRTPRPTRAPRPTATPEPTPEPTVPPEARYHAGERLSGVVLDVSSADVDIKTFVMQSFWQEAIFVAVNDANIGDDNGGGYELKPGARVIVRFAQDVPDVPPFSAGSDEVKIIDYIDESELGVLPVNIWAGEPPSDLVVPPPVATPTSATEADPYYTVFQHILESDAKEYEGLETVAVDISRTSSENTLPFQQRAAALCDEKGFDFLFGSDLELFAMGAMNDDGLVEDGVYIVLSDDGESRGTLDIKARRLFSGQTLESEYALENSGTEEASVWAISD